MYISKDVSVRVCACVSADEYIVPPCGWGQLTYNVWLKLLMSLESRNSSPGHRTMVPLDSCQAQSPAENLQNTQGRNQHTAHRANKGKTAMRKARNVWRAGTWNVRSMVDTEGPIEVASQWNERGEDRKVDLVVGKLARYGVVIGALQETKWFGCGAYQVSNSMVLSSGRCTPGEGECAQRREGVALVLRGKALEAWRRGGQQWKAWSLRCVSAVLQEDRRTVSRIHVVSCYAPTRAASREYKDAFFQELNNIISGVPAGETYIILGDFNACVGSRESDDNEWSV